MKIKGITYIPYSLSLVSSLVTLQAYWKIRSFRKNLLSALQVPSRMNFIHPETPALSSETKVGFRFISKYMFSLPARQQFETSKIDPLPPPPLASTPSS